jgi:hypothetical protein
MATHGSSQPPASLLAKPLAFLTSLLLRAPLAVLIGGLVIALGCVVLAVGWLNFRTSRLDLLNPDSAFNQRWVAYLDEFGDQDDVVIVVDGPSEEIVSAALDELAKSLRQDSRFHSIMHETDLSALRGKGLQFLSLNELERVDEFLAEIEPVLSGDWSQLGIGSFVSNQVGSPGNRSRITGQLAAISRGDVSPVGLSPELARLAEIETRLSSRRLLLNDGRQGLLLLRFAGQDQQITRVAGNPVEALRTRVDAIQKNSQATSIGITGMPILEHDEMHASRRDTTKASVLSLIGVACVFVVGFGGLRRPLLAVAALLIAIAWSFGYVTLAVGHLNILSVAFGVILIGLGIDFGIHYLARYLQLREQDDDPNSAIIATARSVGPGIVTGGLTTAMAFFTAALTKFTGVAELGLIAGGGILLCIVAALIILPALIALSDRTLRTRPASDNLPFVAMCRPLTRYGKLVLAATTAITLMLGTGISRLRYDHNLLNLQPRDQESVAMERKLAATSNQSVWFAVSMCRDREELLDRKERLQQISAVTATEEVVSLVPESSSEKQRLIGNIAGKLTALSSQPPLIPVVDRQILLAGLTQLALGDRANAAAIEDALNRIQQLSPREYFERCSQWQQLSAQQLLDTLRHIRSMADPTPVSIANLPAPLVDRYVGRSGRHLLKVYGQSDLWNMHVLEEFVREVEAVDPKITGHPIQTYYASTQMQYSYIHAAIYALLAVAIVLMLDFRNIRHTLLAMLPITLGLVQLLGLLGWLGIPLNPANMIVLPLILGIGIDDGVHVVHDFLRQTSNYQISNSTVTAVFLTSATTMIGFGSMMVASHQGLRSLGQVLTLGVFCCLVTSILVLPVLLGNRRLLSR